MSLPSKPDAVVVGNYILLHKLCAGPSSTVWRATQLHHGPHHHHHHHHHVGDVAVKQIHLTKLTPMLKASLDCQLSFLSSLSHPHIIRLLHFFQVGGCLFLVFEFCDGGDLASYIGRHGRVEEHSAREFMHQIGSGLRVLRQHHIVHRDLKPENILLSCSDNGIVLKIADFGLSRFLYSGDYAETVCGSPLYMAPEVLGFQRYDEKVDMWSIGIILFELLNGYPPFQGRTNVQILRGIKSSLELPFSKLIAQKLHPDCFDMCSRLLSVNPVDRLSCEEFNSHKFFITNS